MQDMTSKQRIEAALNGQTLDRLPFCPFLAYVWESYPKAIQDRGQLAFLREVGADPLWRGAPCPVGCSVPDASVEQTDDDRWIIHVTTTPAGRLIQRHKKSRAGNTNFLVEHPLKCPEDYKVRLWIEEHTRFEYNLAPVEQHLAGDGREGLSLGMLLPRGKTAFQSLVEHLVGTEELVFALADFPDAVDGLWRAMVARDLQAARLAAESPYEYFITWEDSSTPAYVEQVIAEAAGGPFVLANSDSCPPGVTPEKFKVIVQTVCARR